MSTEIAVFKPTEAVIADLTARYAMVVFDVTTIDGMQDAKKAYKEINGHSIVLEKAREAEKAASLTYGRKVDAEAKSIAEKLDALRPPIKSMIEVETKREEREREEKIAAEKAKIEAEELAKKQAEEKKLAEDRAAIAKGQAELAAQQKAAQDKIDADARAARQKIDDEARAAQAVRDEADRKARLEREALEAEAKQKRDAEEATLKAARDKLEAEQRAADEIKRKEQAEIDAKAKALRDAEEAKQREVLRAKNELLDGDAALQSFVIRFGKRSEYSHVLPAIIAYLATTEKKAA